MMSQAAIGYEHFGNFQTANLLYMRVRLWDDVENAVARLHALLAEHVVRPHVVSHVVDGQYRLGRNWKSKHGHTDHTG